MTLEKSISVIIENMFIALIIDSQRFGAIHNIGYNLVVVVIEYIIMWSL